MSDSFHFLPTIGKVGAGTAGLLILMLAGSSCQPSTRPHETFASGAAQAPTEVPKELQTATFAMG